jgi:ABC-type transport system involved in cytochrome c biogenesis permease subunit
VRKLPPSLRSIWLTLHVSFYKIAFATALMALAFSILYLLRQRSKATWLDRIPPSATLDIVAYRFAGFAFTFWAIGMLAGSIWAYYSWGSFWSWDPIETWSLVTWIVMGVYLHLRRFFGWKGARAAYLYCVCFGFAVATVFFASLIEVTLHGQYFR